MRDQHIERPRMTIRRKRPSTKQDETPDGREPEYTTSLIVTKPIEMIKPNKIAFLIFIKRGWLAKLYCLEPPDRFLTWHARFIGKQHMLHRGSVRLPSTNISANWRRAGIIRSVEVMGCRIGRRYILTAKGESLLENLSPELIAEARAIVRAKIWEIVLSRRSDARFFADVEKQRCLTSGDNA